MTVCLSFLQTEMDEEQQIWTWLIQTNHKLTLRSRSTSHENIQPQQNNKSSSEMQQETCAAAWNSLLSALKSVLKWLYINHIEWPKDINLDAFARRTVTATDSTCPADGVS